MGDIIIRTEGLTKLYGKKQEVLDVNIGVTRHCLLDWLYRNKKFNKK